MKKVFMVGALLVCSIGYLMLHYAAFAGGGDSFIGGFGGAMVGSAVAQSATRSDGSGREALREVGRLEAIMRSDLTQLNNRINDLEKDSPSMEDMTLLAAEVKNLKQSVQELEREIKKGFDASDKQEQMQDKRIAALEEQQRSMLARETIKTEPATQAVTEAPVAAQEPAAVPAAQIVAPEQQEILVQPEK